MCLDRTPETILIVEDHEPSRDALSRRLERGGNRIVAAGDGEQAIALARVAPMLRVSSRPRNGGWSCQPVIVHGTSPASVHGATTKKTAEPDDVVERRPP